MSQQNLKRFTLFLACLIPPVQSIGQDSSPESRDVVSQASDSAQHSSKPPDFNSDIYYKNKVEFSLESGVLPINLPFVFDVFVGGDYALSPLHYTLVPIFPSLRWQMGNISGPWILRGNTDLTATLSVTAIPRGPEKIYDAFDLGFRRNFVHRNWRVAPYFEARIGAGFVDAQEPFANGYYIAYAQGQDLTFTLMTGAGARYNFNGRYSMAVGATYMHMSNAYLSEPKYDDNGINVCGPLIGFNMRLGKPRQ
jgi:Lipid A 3-O-deacylase (PagL)